MIVDWCCNDSSLPPSLALSLSLFFFVFFFLYVKKTKREKKRMRKCVLTVDVPRKCGVRR